MNEFLKGFSQPLNRTSIYIPLAGITYPDTTYRISRPQSNVSVIEYVTDGDGYVVINGETHHVYKDMIYFLEEGAHHTYYSDSETPFTKIFLNITGSFCKQIISAYSLSGRHFFDGNGLKPLFEKILDIIRSDIPDNEMQSALQGTFVEIASRLHTTQTEAEYSDEALQLKNHIDSNPKRIISTDELSRVIFRSQDYCLKLFKREFGTTPYAYQLERKMQLAKSMLTDTHISVGEIAESLGYNDLHYFSNLFLKKCGCRPLHYRKSIK